MVSFTHRYLAGEHEEVWNDLRGLGPVPPDLAPDVAGVAAETMKRVRRHVERLGEAYSALGYDGDPTLVGAVPGDGDRAEADELAEQIGGLPAALDACLKYVGDVSFMGDCRALRLGYKVHDLAPVLPDPLVTADVQYLSIEWEMHKEGLEEGALDDGESFDFPFAPCVFHKANYSGDAQRTGLPSTVADPLLTETGGRTLVEYLRHSIAWGGMPGWSQADEPPPEAVAAMRVTPDF